MESRRFDARPRHLLALLVLPALLCGGPARAIDPGTARYMDDPAEVFWFLQVTDSHVGADPWYGTQGVDNLDWVLGQAVGAILPEFVVLTGDIVDASNELGIPSWQYQEEWDDYRSVVDGYGVDLTFWHDVCGNHDTYLDPGASFYLANSLTGATLGAWHETWAHAFPYADYPFVALDTADTSAPVPRPDSEWHS